jgi:hypothetical protein
MTEESTVKNWEEEQLDTLYNAVLTRTVLTYCLNELVKSGVKTALKDGMILKLRDAQRQANYLILRTVQKIDRGTQ